MKKAIAVMADYRCYFFGTTSSSFGAPWSFKAAETFTVESDEEARLKAESIYRRQHNQIRGFEVWQANRLVHRHIVPSSDSRASSRPAPTLREGQSHER